MSDEIKKLYDSLSTVQREQLSRLRSEITFDRMTVSYSLEDRDATGRKKSAFYSVTVARGGPGGEGFAAKDINITHALVSKHVILGTYDDAVRRGIMTPAKGQSEKEAVLASYDKLIVRLLKGESQGTNQT